MGRVGFQMSISAVIAIVISAIFVAVLISSFAGSDQQNLPFDSSETNQKNEDDSPGQQNSAESNNGSQDSVSSSNDIVNNGEEEVEQYISSVGDSEDLSDELSTYPPIGSKQYNWIEFEDPERQILQNFSNFDNDAPVFFDNERGSLDAMETLYLALSETSDGYDAAWVGLDSDEWEEGEPAPGNSGKTESYPVSVSSESVELFFSSNLEGYNDSSENFPTNLLSSIRE